ncbi:hypothetical protein FA95DRAFT_1668288 [Auriscalpium vulgare]|uniref:Uncharacterized protein n=1 Tax=Auriscalpium vulgare TaxID=40419 RepID=A0ACB8R2X0_9AGAM|nr:hypothetical protein FA95DRAFT_1668288 [Auriscalpium vulgare]
MSTPNGEISVPVFPSALPLDVKVVEATVSRHEIRILACGHALKGLPDEELPKYEKAFRAEINEYLHVFGHHNNIGGSHDSAEWGDELHRLHRIKSLDGFKKLINFVKREIPDKAHQVLTDSMNSWWLVIQAEKDRKANEATFDTEDEIEVDATDPPSNVVEVAQSGNKVKAAPKTRKTVKSAAIMEESGDDEPSVKKPSLLTQHHQIKEEPNEQGKKGRTNKIEGDILLGTNIKEELQYMRINAKPAQDMAKKMSNAGRLLTESYLRTENIAELWNKEHQELVTEISSLKNEIAQLKKSSSDAVTPKKRKLASLAGSRAECVDRDPIPRALQRCRRKRRDCDQGLGQRQQRWNKMRAIRRETRTKSKAMAEAKAREQSTDVDRYTIRWRRERTNVLGAMRGERNLHFAEYPTPIYTLRRVQYVSDRVSTETSEKTKDKIAAPYEIVRTMCESHATVRRWGTRRGTMSSERSALSKDKESGAGSDPLCRRLWETASVSAGTDKARHIERDSEVDG